MDAVVGVCPSARHGTASGVHEKQATASHRAAQGDAAAITEALNETANNQPNQQFVQRKEPELVALDNAALLLNQAAAGEADWDAIRAPLAAQYEEGGFREVADFVRAAGP